MYAALRMPDGAEARIGADLACDALRCPRCEALYPVIEGVPVILPSPQGVDLTVSPPWWPSGWSARAWLALLTGRPADDELSVLASRVARYAWSGFHLGASASPWQPHLSTPLAQAVIPWAKAALSQEPAPRHLVVGAALGPELWLPRADHERAGEGDALSVALDLHLPSLLASKRLWDQGHLTLPVPVDGHGRWRVETLCAPHRPPGVRPAWLCADICNPPFEAASFQLISALNVLDSVPTPYIMLGQCHALLSPGAGLVLSSPFAWRADITPASNRLGPAGVDDAQALLSITAGFEPSLLLCEQRAFDWLLRQSDTEAVLYRSLAFCFQQPR